MAMQRELSLRRCLRALSVAGPLVLWFATSADGQTTNSYPMLMSLKPVAARIGDSSLHELNARYNLAGATEVFVSGTGVHGAIEPDDSVKPEEALRNDVGSSKCRIRFTVDRDAIPGVRDFRVITPHGASTVGQLVIVRDPVVVEVADNDSPEKGQKIDAPCTLCGTIEKAEDLDFFRFVADAGSSLTFHFRSQRLLNRLHDMQTRIDPIISIRNAQGTLLAVSDNYYAGDPLLNYTFDQSGEYMLEVRDVRYQGNADWAYSLEVLSRPFVTQVVPNIMQRGVATPVELVGFRLPVDARTELSMAQDCDLGRQAVTPRWHDEALNDVLVFVTDEPVQPESSAELTVNTAVKVEKQSDEETLQTASINKVQPILWPGVVAGRLAREGEVDSFPFTAKSQDRISFEVFARRGGSQADPIVRIVNAEGAAVTEADDTTFERVTSADSWIENWSVPADGNYRLEVRDLHQRGGVDFPYGVIIRRAEPFYQLEVDTDKTLLAPGMGSAFFVRAIRKNGFAGEIKLSVEGLPPGVSATCGRILPDVNDGCVVLVADANATPTAQNVLIYGEAEVSNSKGEAELVKVRATPLQEYYSPGGGRGNYPVDMHTVSVSNPMDIRAIRLSATDVVLKPGGVQRIDIEIERAPDYQGNVTLDVIMQHLEQPYGNSLPKGVKVDVAASKTLLTGTDSTGYITLAAAADAPATDKQLVPVLAHVSINFVMKHTFCTKPLLVSVVPDQK